jgi:hypothetical protein
VHRTPRPMYELEDLWGQQIDGQFYAEELRPVLITKRRTYKIDKILKKRVRRGILEYLVRWAGCTAEFISWILASAAKNIWSTKTNMDIDRKTFYVTLFSNS